MSRPPSVHSSGNEAEPDHTALYRQVLETLNASRVPYLVGGGYALHCHTGIKRQTKDLDLFIRPADYGSIRDALQRAGYTTELVHPHWLGKVKVGPVFIDLIFNSGNGICEVDDDWFVHARQGAIHGIPVRISPVEEMIWSKAFVMERERYDGADVAHLLHACSSGLDWRRLLRRFDAHWRVLLSHLVLFGFVFPTERARVPEWLVEELLDRLRRETHTPPPPERVCGGTLLSREQYLDDIGRQGYRDGRLPPFGKMSPKQTAEWTKAIPDRTRDSG